MTLGVALLVLTNSKTMLASIVQGGQQGMGRTRNLVEVVDEVGCRLSLELLVRSGWVEAQVRIPGNQRADVKAKSGCRPSLLWQVSQGGVRAMWKRI